LDDYKKTYSFQTWENASPLKEGIDTKRFQWSVEFARQHGVKRGLDIGTFDGNIPIRMNETLGIEYDGVDCNDNFTNIGLEYAKANKLDKVNIYPNTLFEEFNVNGRRYDLVTALEVVEHVIDIKGMYKKIDSLLNDGGYVLISTPHKDGIYGETDANELHIRAYDEESIVKDFPENWKVIQMFTDAELLCVAVRKQ
jgi:2-polyprenyl-3-methyl-5-hydroxy-6-metoxy-1,4-benzoquinol methylase